MTVPYRTIAERTLSQAAGKLNEIPRGNVNAQEITARSQQAQAIATVAVAQALLEIGDVLRAAFAPDGAPDGPPADAADHP